MNKAMRIGAVVLALGAVGGAAFTVAGSGGPRTVVSAGRVEESASDAKADKGQPATPSARVDIKKATAEYRPDGFLDLAVMVKEPVAPYEDANWGADGTFLTWEVDTTGDGAEDFEISLYNEDGKLTGDVTRDATAEDSVVCSILLGSYDPATGYRALVDPKCLGNPTTLAYRVTYYYQTDASQDDAPVISDTAPDKGMTEPLEGPGTPPAQ